MIEDAQRRLSFSIKVMLMEIRRAYHESLEKGNALIEQRISEYGAVANAPDTWQTPPIQDKVGGPEG